MESKTVYIAGPMSNQPMWNFPAFFDAENQLLELGYSVSNPARHDGVTIDEALRMAGSPERPTHPWAWYMKRDLPMVMNADYLCLLPGWQESKGARLEVHVAKALGIPLMILRDGNLVPRVEVVGLSGWARSGKDTVADYLVEEHGFTKMSFAEPMREALKRLDPLIMMADGYSWESYAQLSQALEHHSWEELKSLSPQIRPYLQRFGTEVGREMFGEDFWVDYAMDRIPDGAKVVFSDTRFRNEANAIKALGGNVWRVVREGVSAANDHISEHDLDEYEFTAYIRNYRDLEHLYGVVEHAIHA